MGKLQASFEGSGPDGADSVNPVRGRVKQGFQIQEKYKGLDLGVFVDDVGIKDVHATCVYPLFRLGVVQFILVSNFSNLLLTRNIARSGIAAHGHVPVRIAWRQLGERVHHAQ